MYLLLTILILIASIALVLFVLVQNSKGGGLSSGFSSSNQIMGVRKTTDFLEKATWSLAITICVLSMAAAAFVPHEQSMNGRNSEIKGHIENTQPVAPLADPNMGDIPAADSAE